MIQLFAHRGFVGPFIEDSSQQNIVQNSIASLKNAREFGFKGIEFDIWFLNQKLFLKHDEPQQSELENLPSFAEYLLFKNDFIYWLDFKNLDETNASAALKLIKEELDTSSIDMAKVYFAPFITDYKIAQKVFLEIRKIFGEKVNLVAVCEELKNEMQIKSLRDFLTKNNIKFLSIFHKLIDENLVKILADIKFFAWTVNDLKSLERLERLGVKNFATDKLTP